MGEAYAERAFSPDAKRRVSVMMREIKKAMEANIKALDWLSFNVGYSTDDPFNDDLKPAGIAWNRTVYMTAHFNFGPFAFGLEYLYWDTAFKDFGGGRANRVTVWGSYSF